jgi:Zn-dependent M28 family amino/carboxypeptidase
MSPVKDDHLNFRKYGVPTFLMIDFTFRVPAHLQQLRPNQPPQQRDGYEQWWHTPDDNLDAMDPVSLAIAGNLVIEALADLDAFVIKK